MNKSKIEWCDYTWNPVTGCYHGCEYCYARKIANRFGEYDVRPYKKIHVINGKCTTPYPALFEPTFHMHRLDEPTKKKNGVNIFVSSMGDLFGDWVPDEWIKEVFKACDEAPQHRYMFLTKNYKRYYQLAKDYNIPKNVWLGMTAVNQEQYENANGITLYLSTNGYKTFLSIEPIQEEIYLNHCMADWIIVGQETGNRKEKIKAKNEWMENILRYDSIFDPPIFLKDNLGWHEEIKEYPKELTKD